MGVRNSHCSFCGAAFPAGAAWPRRCGACGETSYLNPLPVAVALLPTGSGLLAVRRAVPPGVGLLALPGGYIDLGESWQQAVVRELREETGIRAGAADVALHDVRSAPDGTVLIFGLLPRREHLPEPVASAETTGWEVIDGPGGMAFELHAAVVAGYFARKSRVTAASSGETAMV